MQPAVITMGSNIRATIFLILTIVFTPSFNLKILLFRPKVWFL